MRIILPLTVLIINLLNISCMSNTTLYEYADGSANVYKLTSTTLEYIPVKKEESSTGMYSGGDPKTEAITKTQYESVSKLLESALSNTSIHIEDRMKTSGAILAIDGDKKRRCIIKPKCAEMIAIEDALKAVLGK